MMLYHRRAVESFRSGVGGLDALDCSGVASGMGNRRNVQQVAQTVFGIPQQKGVQKSHAVREVRKTGMLIREALAVAYGMYRSLVVSAWPGNLKLSELTDRMKRVGRPPAPSVPTNGCFRFQAASPEAK